MINKKIFLSIAAAVLGNLSVAFAQSADDRILFSIGEKSVPVSEFKYIYEKNNTNSANYSEQSLREYLQLYINFKLQLLHAEELGITSDEKIQKEQKQYRDQLANNYLTDKEVSGKLIKEAYERSKEDRRVSHIFIPLKEDASEDVVKTTYEQMQAILKEVTPKTFAQIASLKSLDQYSKNNGGDLGYYTVFQMPYAFETAMYNLKKDEVSDIVRTPYGLHILMLTDIRPALGQMQVAHLFVRKSTNNGQALIDSIYAEIQKGANFETLVETHSQDNSTKKIQGVLGWIGINQYDENFEKAIFSLTKDGQISKPISSENGWHILKRVKAIQNPPFNEVKQELSSKVQKDARYALVQKALVERIKKESNFQLNADVYTDLKNTLKADTGFFNMQWKAPETMTNDNRILFSLGTEKFTIAQFKPMLEQYSPERFQAQKNIDKAFGGLVNKAITNTALKYEETQLEKKYPEFKELWREYEEGIVVFAAKQRLIWDKAAQDSTGIEAFYDANKNKYQSKEKAEVHTYVINSLEKKQIKAIQKAAKKMSAEDIKEKFNQKEQLVAISTQQFDKTALNNSTSLAKGLKWKANTASTPEVKDGKTIFAEIDSIIPSTTLSLKDARGLVVADYQVALEKALLDDLNKNNPAKVNEDVFKSLTK